MASRNTFLLGLLCFPLASSFVLLRQSVRHVPPRGKFSMQSRPPNAPPARMPVQRSRLQDPSSLLTQTQALAFDRQDVDICKELNGFSGYAVCENEVVADDIGDFSIAQARLMILLAALLCGTNFGSIKFLQGGGLEPSMFLSARFVLAAAVMSPLLAKTNAKCILGSAEAGLWLGLGYVFQAAALQTTPAGTTAFLCSLTTVVCPIIEKFTGVRVTTQAWGAAAMAVAGAAVLELSGDEVPGRGDLLALMQPIMFGFNFFRTEQVVREFPDQVLPSTTIQVGVCALLGVAWSFWDAGGIPDLSPLLAHAHEPAFDFALLWVSLVSTALILVLQGVSLGKLPSSEAAVVFSSEPLWAAGFASVLIGEEIGVNTIFGGSLIIAACMARVVDIDRVRRRVKVVRRKAAKTLATLTLQR